MHEHCLQYSDSVVVNLCTSSRAVSGAYAASAQRNSHFAVELRTLPHGSAFFRGWSGIAFNVSRYFSSVSFRFSSFDGSAGLSFAAFTPGLI